METRNNTTRKEEVVNALREKAFELLEGEGILAESINQYDAMTVDVELHHAAEMICKIIEDRNEAKALGFAIKEAYAVYTGGGIWLFHGKIDDGKYFLTDDYGFTLILNADPSDFEESLYEDWQKDHTITELSGKQRLLFCECLVKRLRAEDSSHRGGITEEELDYYSDYFKEEI